MPSNSNMLAIWRESGSVCKSSASLAWLGTLGEGVKGGGMGGRVKGGDFRREIRVKGEV